MAVNKWHGEGGNRQGVYRPVSIRCFTRLFGSQVQNLQNHRHSPPIRMKTQLVTSDLANFAMIILGTLGYGHASYAAPATIFSPVPPTINAGIFWVSRDPAQVPSPTIRFPAAIAISRHGRWVWPPLDACSRAWSMQQSTWSRPALSRLLTPRVSRPRRPTSPSCSTTIRAEQSRCG